MAGATLDSVVSFPPADDTERIESLTARIALLEAENARLRGTVFELPASETLAAVIQASPLPIVALTREGKITLWNAAAERVFGWSAEEVLGKALPFIPKDKREEHRHMRAQDLTGQGFTGIELVRHRKDGTSIDISVSTAPIRNPDGAIIGIMSVYVDITERKSTEYWLHRQAELLEQAHDAMLVWKIDGAIEYWNRAAEELYGFTKQEAVGRVSHELLQTETLSGESFLPELRRLGRWSAELLHTTRDGRRIVVESRQVVVGTPGVVLESNRDITGRVRTERELRSANEALQRANSDLEQFAYAAAHDLQEPLRNIALFGQLLTRRYIDALAGDGVDFMNTIIQGAHRMQSLVNDLLAYTSSVQEESSVPEMADANRVLERVLEDLTTRIAESGAAISAGKLPVLPLSETHLAQLLHNLIGNAIKYCRPDVQPLIRVEARAEGADWLLSIRDNGQGIPPEYRERVFGLFKRLHSAEVPGTGLGLAICKRIVEHYGGRIWIADGESGQGTTFWIALPF